AASALMAAAARGFVVLRLSATGAGLLAAVGLAVHGGPGAAFRLALGDAALLVAFLDVFGLSLLLVRVGRLVATWHDDAPWLSVGDSGRVRAAAAWMEHSACPRRFQPAGEGEG